MNIDVLINYQNENLTIESKATYYKEARPSNIGLSKSKNYIIEQVEGVGEDWTTADLEQMSVGFRPAGGIYRVINPLALNSFEVWAAARMIKFFCRKARMLAHPKTYHVRELFGIDKIVLTLILPHYGFLPTQTKKDFEEELRKFTKRLEIISKSF
jgi:hypothetical protein